MFHSSLYQFDQPQPSYWEDTAPDPGLSGRPLGTTESCEVAVIGGGYTGVSAALHLARDHQVDVRVLEAGHIGWGASGRNGAFCTIGSTKLSLKTQISRFGLEQTRYYYQCMVDAVELVRETGVTENIDFQIQGDGELVVADYPQYFSSFAEEASFHRKTLGLDVQVLSREQFREQGYASPHQHGALHIKPSFALHPLRYTHGLARAAENHGARIHPHSKVLRWDKQNGKHRLETDSGTLLADKVILTGNGFMPEYLHKGIQGRPLPIQSAIVVSAPLTDEQIAATNWSTLNPFINSKQLFFYFRLLPDRRLLLGARANHIGDLKGLEQTFAFMKQSIGSMWPSLATLQYQYQWRGLVCFAMNLRPSIGRMPDDHSVYFGYGYHGNGVSTATWSGREIARWLTGHGAQNSAMPTHLPAIMQGRSPRFPLALLRRQYLQTALLYYGLRDRIDHWRFGKEQVLHDY